MFGTLRTLWAGAEARAEEGLRQAYAVELIDQKIREAEAALRQAKGVLASLILRERTEARGIATLEARLADLTARAKAALAAGREDLGLQAAEAMAVLENEALGRRETRSRLEARILRLQDSVAASHRKIIDLRQGAVSARAFRDEQGLQARLRAGRGGPGAMEEAEALIAQVLGREDRFEEAEVLAEIERGLSGEQVAERMAAAGFGPALKVTGAEVMARLKSQGNAA